MEKPDVKIVQGFRALIRQFERQITYQENFNNTTGITLPQCYVLLEIEREEETTIGTLSQVMNLNKSTISRTVESLVGHQLVQRITSDEDRRCANVSLTAEGKNTCKLLNSMIDSYLERVFSHMPQVLHETFLEYFSLFIRAMKEVYKADSSNIK